MKTEDFNILEPGDIIRNFLGEAYVVVKMGPQVVAIRTIGISNASEWEKVIKSPFDERSRGPCPLCGVPMNVPSFWCQEARENHPSY